MIETSDRAAVGHLITMAEYVDVIVPRGGKSLIERVTNEARIPVIKHLDGNCHVFVEAQADLQKALPITLNAKTHRYGVCNAMETLLVDEKLQKFSYHTLLSFMLKNKLSYVVAQKHVVFWVLLSNLRQKKIGIPNI